MEAVIKFERIYWNKQCRVQNKKGKNKPIQSKVNGEVFIPH